MPQTIHTFAAEVSHRGGTRYRVSAEGEPRADGRWEGWLAFQPLPSGTPLRTGRETTQPDRVELEYWASGLEPVYLEGALDRALRHADPEGSGGAHPRAEPERAAAPPAIPPRAVLDPFVVSRQGEDVLRAELGALDESHQRSIIEAYGLGGEPDQDLRLLDREALTAMIIAGVRRRNRGRPPGSGSGA
jgi:hypothetical protein